MNAHSEIVVSFERVVERLKDDMRHIYSSSLYSNEAQKVEALCSLYGSHLYVQGSFSSEKSFLGGIELHFNGRICDVAHCIRIF